MPCDAAPGRARRLAGGHTSPTAERHRDPDVGGDHPIMRQFSKSRRATPFNLPALVPSRQGKWDGGPGPSYRALRLSRPKTLPRLPRQEAQREPWADSSGCNTGENGFVGRNFWNSDWSDCSECAECRGGDRKVGFPESTLDNTATVGMTPRRLQIRSGGSCTGRGLTGLDPARTARLRLGGNGRGPLA